MAESEGPIANEALVIPLLASSLHSALPLSCRIPIGFGVGYRKINGALEVFEDAEAFFRAHAGDWTEITSYQLSREGSVMSAFIHGIVNKGIKITTIQDRCVHVKINNMVYFGVLNCTFNPCGDDAVPKHMIDSIAYVILLQQSNINRKMSEHVESFVNYLQEPVAYFLLLRYHLQNILAHL